MAGTEQVHIKYSLRGIEDVVSREAGQGRGPETGVGGTVRELMSIVIIQTVENWEGRRVSINKEILWAEAGWVGGWGDLGAGVQQMRLLQGQH